MTTSLKGITFWLLIIGQTCCASVERAPAMATQKIPVRFEKFGDVRIDNYYWMKERDSAPVLEFLNAENQRTDQAMADTQALQTKLMAEMRHRIKEDDTSVPVKDGAFYYLTRYEVGKEYPIFLRRRQSLEGAEEVIANVNELAIGSSYYNCLSPVMSPDQKIAALATDNRGRRFYEIFFKDMATGKILSDRLPDTTGNLVWAQDGQTVFYAKQDPETLRSFQIYRYRLGGGAPVLVYQEDDETFSVGVAASKDHSMLLIQSEATVSTEVRYLKANQPAGKWQVLAPRERHHEYQVSFGGDRFYIVTNWQATNFRLMEAPLNAHGKEQWKEVVAHRSDVLIEHADIYQNHVVLAERSLGLNRIEVMNRKTKESRVLEFPDEAYEADLMPLPEYDGPGFRYSYESLVRPPSVFDYRFSDGQATLRKEKEVPGLDRSRYATRRLWATAPDGVKVPISLVYAKDRPLNAGPLLLYGYGSYGLSLDAWFDSDVFSLVDRGFAYAIAHIRGGSEMGRHWYDDGKLLKKRNTFTDFIACAEFLIKEKWTSPQHLYINGGSAGGLLMGAVTNMRPDLFRGVVADVPFVDVLTTMLDDSIPLTTSEYDEWGNPNDRAFYEYMRTYSPYDNIEAKSYPHLLVNTGYHDSQVQYWEPAKWVAKLRDYKTDDHMLLLKTKMETGHSGSSGRFERLKDTALSYAFFLKIEGP